MSKFEQLWTENNVLRWLSIAILAGLAIASNARAVEPGWYAPADNGEGLIVRCNDSGGCAMVWLTHAGGGQLWLISNGNCPRISQVCDMAMSETTGTWRGLVGETELADPTVTLSVTQNLDGVLLDWDARAQFPDRCFDTGTGGLLLRGCVGKKQFDLLAR